MKLQNKIKSFWYVDDQKHQQLNNIAYRSVIDERWNNFNILLSKVINKHDAKTKSLKILDAGSGDGININFLLNFFQSRKIKIRLTALDYNKVRLKRLNKIKNINIEYGNILNIKHPKEKFDFILCSHVIEHIENCVDALKELKRVLKKDGFLILSIPNEGCFFAQFRNNILQRKILKNTDHKHFFTKHMFLTLSKKVGFKLEHRILYEGFSFPHSGVDRRLRRFSFWRKIMKFFLKLFPSQCAGLTFLFVKD
jgi:ubiquinone/menaquinone biosynthesis C-methylase UbiE